MTLRWTKSGSLAVEDEPGDGKAGAVRVQLARPLLVRVSSCRSSAASKSVAMRKIYLVCWTLIVLGKLIRRRWRFVFFVLIDGF